jgi:hypothetical protein
MIVRVTSQSLESLIVLVTWEIERFVDANEPTVNWENDGIGAYEFWGTPCFDAGTNYPIAEDCLEDVSLDLTGLSGRLINWVGKRLSCEENPFKSSVDVDICGNKHESTIRCPYEVSGYRVDGSHLTLELSWDDAPEEID